MWTAKKNLNLQYLMNIEIKFLQNNRFLRILGQLSE